jgi:peptide/nickel transport system permease protein
MLMFLFAMHLGWLPVVGATSAAVHDSLSPMGQLGDRLRHLVLPASTLALIGCGSTARFQRARMIEVLSHDYIRTARAKGLGEFSVVVKHGLRNSLLPIITLLGLSFPVLLSGSVLVETVFAWPGMGWLATESIGHRDYLVVVAISMIATAMVVAGNALADVLYRLADPRTRS